MRRTPTNPARPDEGVDHHSHLFSTHYVTGVGRVGILKLSGAPFGIIVPQREGYGFIWADRPEVGPQQVLSALRKFQRMDTKGLAEYLQMARRKVAGHLRTLIRWGLVKNLQPGVNDAEYIIVEKA